MCKNDHGFGERGRKILVGSQNDDSRICVDQSEQSYFEISVPNDPKMVISAPLTATLVNIAIYTAFLNFGAQLNSH